MRPDRSSGVGSRRVELASADAHHLAVHEDELGAKHVVGGEPEFQAAPPELSATLPPIEQAIWIDGLGA